jgi:hypothetical protein
VITAIAPTPAIATTRAGTSGATPVVAGITTMAAVVAMMDAATVEETVVADGVGMAEVAVVS